MTAVVSEVFKLACLWSSVLANLRNSFKTLLHFLPVVFIHGQGAVLGLKWTFPFFNVVLISENYFLN